MLQCIWNNTTSDLCYSVLEQFIFTLDLCYSVFGTPLQAYDTMYLEQVQLFGMFFNVQKPTVLEKMKKKNRNTGIIEFSM